MRRSVIILASLASLLARAEETVATASVADCPFDTRTIAIHVASNAVSEIFDLAYNNTADWTRGGDADADTPTIRITEMDANGTPGVAENWKETSCVDTFAQMAREGTWCITNVVDRRAYFRAELLVGGDVRGTAYFDFGNCSEAGLKNTLSTLPHDNATVSIAKDQGSTVVTATVFDRAGNLFAAEDYAVTYDESRPREAVIRGQGSNWRGRMVIALKALEILNSSVKMSGVGFDTRILAVRAIATSADDLLDLSYNNTADWRMGGDGGVPAPTIRLVEMDAHDTPADVGNWTDTAAATDLACEDSDGVLRWVSERKAFYRAELVAGTETNGIAHFDFSGCTDKGIKNTLSLFKDGQQSFVLVYHRDGNPRYTVSGALVDSAGNELVEGTDYTLAYATNALAPNTTQPITVVATGRNWGGVATLNATFSNVVASVLGRVPFDTRGVAVYVVTNETEDLFGFAYNNTAEWACGGDPDAAGATIRITKMDPNGMPATPAKWTETARRCDCVQREKEGTFRWEGWRKAYFRAERLVGGVVRETAYFDCSGYSRKSGFAVIVQ